MSYKVEIALIAVLAIGSTAYFSWRYFSAEGDGNLVYIAMIIVGMVFTHRAINDVREKRRRAQASDEDEGNDEQA